MANINGNDIVSITVGTIDPKRYYVYYELSQRWVEVDADAWSKWSGIKKIVDITNDFFEL